MTIPSTSAFDDFHTTHRSSWWVQFLALKSDQASFAVRGFRPAGPEQQQLLEAIGEAFIAGYNAALVSDDIKEIWRFIDTIQVGLRGFAAEGAAMGAAISDTFSIRRRKLHPLVEAFDNEFSYLVHVGAGWALARVPWRQRAILSTLDPIHHWLAFDGLGFHDAYFYHRRILRGWRRKRVGYAARSYDQGIGRALWFIEGGAVAPAVDAVNAFELTRRGDLWAGLGLAMTYAGGGTPACLEFARRAAGPNLMAFAQGVAFACEAHSRSGHIPVHTDTAAKTVARVDASTLAKLVRQARHGLPTSEGNPPRYELWRHSVAAAVAALTGQEQ